MPSRQTILRRRMKALSRSIRGVRQVVRALVSTDHPLLAHIIPIRRCNLACEYCNEYDDFSKPVPTESMFQRVDKLGDLGTSVDYHQWWRTSTPPRVRRDHPPHPQKRQHRRTDYEWLPAYRRPY